jgi:ATP-dependent Clp protease protease subunit
MEKVGQTASINIYGDICSWAWEEMGDMSAVILSKQLDAIGDVDQIEVHINSYGGEVAEGLAIYNALKRHKAKVTTYCDGFACSIASVIFMAGDERVMSEASLLMIHNAWTRTAGNAEELRKQADDLEKITQASVNAYKANSALSEDEIKSLMDAETWILPEDALAYGFATRIDKTENSNANQNAFMKLFEIVKKYQAEDKDEEETEEETEIETEETEEETQNEETTETETEIDDESETEDETEDEETPDESVKEASQKWVGFLNAITKL